MSRETIYAVSSAPGKAGVAVVRVSGPGSLESFCALTGIDEPSPRRVYFRPLKNLHGDLLDQAVAIFFKGPASFTGEDVAEYHLHGSPAVIASFFAALSAFAEHRPAEHGEYTRRAFENGKLDLTEAEAVADLINAETQAQKEQALLQMGGALSRLYEGWRQRLIRAMAYIETVIDFPDEDIPDDQVKTAYPDLRAIATEIRAHLNDGYRGERLRDGIHIVIIGAPNAGKSSLLNRLARRDAAIVSPLAGTTRDIVEVSLDLAGYPVILSDTAGLRQEVLPDDDGHGAVEAEGIRRALDRATHADIKILLFDGTIPPDEKTLALIDGDSIAVLNKSDMPGYNPSVSGAIPVSLMTGDGLDKFLAALTKKIEERYSVARETPSITRARHRAALEDCVSCIEAGLSAALPELLAEDVRMAARSLGRITGRVDVEDLLDVIFRDFCIGK